jgi:hypothetical protein
VVYVLKLATLKLVARCSLSILIGFSVFVFVTAALPFSPALADGTLEINPTSGEVGSTINYTLSGWTPDAYYYIWFDKNGDGLEPFRYEWNLVSICLSISRFLALRLFKISSASYRVNSSLLVLFLMPIFSPLLAPATPLAPDPQIELALWWR